MGALLSLSASLSSFSYEKRVCQNTLFITEDRYIAELSYEVAI